MNGLTNLTGLWLYNNLLSDIDVLSELINPTQLILSYNQISDISALNGLPDLDFLNLGNNPISDIGFLSGLTQLIQLWLVNNEISNIGALADFLNLRNNSMFFTAGLRLQHNFIDVTADSSQRQIIDALGAIDGLTVEFELQKEPDTDVDGMGDSFEQLIIDADSGDTITTLADVLPDDDFDGDGFANQIEHFMGLDPLINDGDGAFEVFDDGSFLTLSYRRSKVAPPAFGQVEWSINLLDWYETDITGTVVEDLGDVEIIDATVPRGCPKIITICFTVS